MNRTSSPSAHNKPPSTFRAACQQERDDLTTEIIVLVIYSFESCNWELDDGKVWKYDELKPPFP